MPVSTGRCEETIHARTLILPRTRIRPRGCVRDRVIVRVPIRGRDRVTLSFACLSMVVFQLASVSEHGNGHGHSDSAMHPAGLQHGKGHWSAYGHHGRVRGCVHDRVRARFHGRVSVRIRTLKQTQRWQQRERRDRGFIPTKVSNVPPGIIPTNCLVSDLENVFYLPFEFVMVWTIHLK